MKAVKRNWFMKGDLVCPKNSENKIFMYVEPVGFDSAKVIDESKSELIISIFNNPLVFAPGFDPGMICDIME